MGDSPEVEIVRELAELLDKMRKLKPNDRGKKDRSWAVAITETEKLYAYWSVYVVDKGA